MSSDSGADVAPDSPTGIAAIGGGRHAADSVRVTVVGSADDGLDTPRDLAFRPDAESELWVVNSADNSVVVFSATGTAAQSSVKHVGSQHFLARPSAIAFGQPGRVATAHEQDQITQRTTPAEFMGPTLWPSDPTVFDGSDRTHLDMLHNSPNAVGLAWAAANTFWVFDGAHQSLTRYNFNRDHGLGGTPHADGDVARFVDGALSYVADVSSGVEVDRATGFVYAADTGHSRVVVLDPSMATRGPTITPNFDGDRQYHMLNGQLRVFADGAIGLRHPSGLALRDGVLFVGDNATSKIFAFSLGGALLDWIDLSPLIAAGSMMGLELSAQNEIFVVDAAASRVLRLQAL